MQILYPPRDLGTALLLHVDIVLAMCLAALLLTKSGVEHTILPIDYYNKNPEVEKLVKYSIVAANKMADSGRTQEAIVFISRALDADPQCTTALKNRSIFYIRAHNNQAALADCNALMRLEPNDPDNYNNRGNANYYLGRNQEALSDYSVALSLDPNLKEGWYNRALQYESQGQIELALKDYDRCLKVDPGNRLAVARKLMAQISFVFESLSKTCAKVL